ncbi:Uncharacterized protein AXF42_Ash016031 [Apostasia shenzhenica]|uniref:Uncharacterized protein n=1 Tax=Apostasia shenzhenica TaxID=1088818 RepID=A0A2I0B372_9ASPA|nr:Uncharacterized protein AXF42_Ash016031 [Apostasia shenzhenica]
MAPLHLLTLLILTSSATVATASNHSSPSAPITSPPSLRGLSAYDVLQSYGFPIGLLPKGALDYDLDPSTGGFSVHFNGTCSFSLEAYQIRYQSTVTGQISPDRLSNLRGVSVKVLLFWINIIEVVNSGDELDFSVGIASAGFPMDNFYISPQCGCGLNCDSGGRLGEESGAGVKLRSNM